MATITGVIESITARPTRVGDMYDVTVNGRKYGNGKFAPRGFKAGDMVTFDYEEKPNGQYMNYNIVPRTMRAAEGQSQQASPAPVVRQTVSSTGGVDRRQEIISKQSAMNTALTLIGLQLQHGALKLPAKTADAYTVLNNLMAATVARVYSLNTGDTWNLTGEDFSKVETPEVPEFDDSLDNI